MTIKTIGGLTGILISLLAATQLGAEVPLDYRIWPYQSQKLGGMVRTYRNMPDKNGNSSVVREFLEYFRSENGSVIPWMIVGYGAISASNPEKTPLEIKVMVGDKRHAGDRDLYDMLYDSAVEYCGVCHPITTPGKRI